MATVITQDELLEALAKANAAPAEARTVAELCALFGWGERRVRDAIGRLAMQDRIVMHKRQRRGIDGRSMTVPVYAILPAPKAKK